MSQMSSLQPPKLTAYVRARWRETGLPLTVREIQAEYGLSSSSVALYWIDKAIAAGMLTRTAGITRSILPADWKDYLKDE